MAELAARAVHDSWAVGISNRSKPPPPRRLSHFCIRDLALRSITVSPVALSRGDLRKAAPLSPSSGNRGQPQERVRARLVYRACVIRDREALKGNSNGTFQHLSCQNKRIPQGLREPDPRTG